jgi:hypothetical protein
MQTALRLTARVQAGHQMEIVAPELTEGEEVTILVTPTAQTMPAPLRPMPPEAREFLARHLLASGAISAIPAGRVGLPPSLRDCIKRPLFPSKA